MMNTMRLLSSSAQTGEIGDSLWPISYRTRNMDVTQSVYYKWSKEFLEAGKARLASDTKRQATGSEVKELRQENEQLKQAVAELLLQNRVPHNPV
jgi:transposase